MGSSPASTSLSLTHDGEVVGVLSVGPLAPGESQLVRLGSQLEVAGSNRFRVSIDADHLVDDNTAYLAIEVPDQLKVLVVEGREREARYLDLALRLRRSGYAQGLDCVTVPSSSVGKQDVETADVVVLANVADLSDDGLESLTESVLKGTGLIVYAGDQMDDFAAERILGRLMPLSYLSSVDPESGESHRLRMDGPPNRISLELSRLEAELSECIVRGYHDLKPSSQAKVVLSLSNGKPLLLTQKAGKGKVAFLHPGPDGSGILCRSTRLVPFFCIFYWMNCARAQSNVFSKSANPWRSKLLRAASERNLNLLIPVGNGAFPGEGRVVKVKKRAFCWASAVSPVFMNLIWVQMREVKFLPRTSTGWKAQSGRRLPKS